MRSYFDFRFDPRSFSREIDPRSNYPDFSATPYGGRSQFLHGDGVPFPIRIQSADILRRDGPRRRAARRGNAGYMPRRDIIHMPATRLARHSGRRGNITFFPTPPHRLACARLNTRPSVPLFFRPPPQPRAAGNDADRHVDTFSSVFPLERRVRKRPTVASSYTDTR